MKKWLRNALSEIAFVWWQVTHPVVAVRWRRGQRQRDAAVRARFEAFKRSRGR